MECHQHKIRIEKSENEKLTFDLSKISLKNTEIKLISKKTASEIIIQYEWLKTMPYIVNYCFGIYFKVDNESHLGGVLTFGIDYAENTGVWKKYGFDDKVLLLNRGVCLWWTPKNTASYFISRSCKWIKENSKYRIITATVDPAAGEVGTIYQALNWHYIGVMSGNYYHNKETKRFSVLIDGKLRYSRWIRNKLGTMKKNEILKHYPNAIFISQYRKKRYFHFMDTNENNLKYFISIKHLILPYEKRSNCVVGLIYMIRNKFNDKKYIGQTTRSFADRINDYKRGFGNNYLNNAFNKYGWDNFEFSIIDTANNLEELNNKEIKYIKEYDTTNKTIGYNIESGGNNAIPSAETLEKLSKSHTGIKQDSAWIEKRIPKAGSEEAKKFGRSKTEEEKKFLSENSPKFWLGKTRSDKTRIKISETKKANGQSEKQIIASNKSVYSINLETREVISYTSTAQAAIAIKVNQSSISRYCSKDKIVDGFVWTYNKDINIEQLIADNKNQNELKEKKIDEIKMIAALNKPTIIKEPKKRNYEQQSEDWINKRIQASIKTVVKLDLRNNKILETYVSLAEASRKNNDGLSYGSLIRLCLGYSKQNENCVWCYEEDFINNTIPIYSKEIIRPIDTLLEEELSEIQEKFKNGSSVRELSDEYNLNFSTLSHLLKKNNGVESIFDPSCNYAAICKKTSKKFSDYLNKSGTLTAHISSIYPDVIIESKFKRKQIEINTGKPWYYNYFLFEKH
jgi:group I intron endonuclease